MSWRSWPMVAYLLDGKPSLSGSWTSFGNEKTALAWLEKAKNVPALTPVRDYSLQPRFSDFSFLHLAIWGLDVIGLRSLSRNVQEWSTVAAAEHQNLTSVALWHPPVSN